jgi:hypothetical protein
LIIPRIEVYFWLGRIPRIRILRLSWWGARRRGVKAGVSFAPDVIGIEVRIILKSLCHRISKRNFTVLS